MKRILLLCMLIFAMGFCSRSQNGIGMTAKEIMNIKTQQMPYVSIAADCEKRMIYTSKIVSSKNDSSYLMYETYFLSKEDVCYQYVISYTYQVFDDITMHLNQSCYIDVPGYIWITDNTIMNYTIMLDHYATKFTLTYQPLLQ